MTRLKPCPFCGGKAKTNHNEWIVCENRCAMTCISDGKGHGKTLAKQTKIWNKRVEPKEAK